LLKLAFEPWVKVENAWSPRLFSESTAARAAAPGILPVCKTLNYSLLENSIPANLKIRFRTSTTFNFSSSYTEYPRHKLGVYLTYCTLYTNRLVPERGWGRLDLSQERTTCREQLVSACCKGGEFDYSAKNVKQGRYKHVLLLSSTIQYLFLFVGF